MDESNVPAELKYTKGHEWVKIEGDVVTMGITDFAQHSLTDIVFVELPEKGKKVYAGKSFCVVESVKSVSDVYAPVNGEVLEANGSLEQSPENVNKEPYGEGWIAKIKTSDSGELENLMDSEAYKKYLAEQEH